MTRSERLFNLTALLQDGKTHKAGDLAERFEVTERTIYRDMDRLRNSGVPVKGTPGEGYRATAELTLPPMNLSGSEMEVLRLGLSVITDAGDETQREAALSLTKKLDHALGEGLGETAISPIPSDAKLQRHLSQIRQAISARQKLRVSQRQHVTTIRPLRLDFFGRIWRCVCWNEEKNDFNALPLSEIGYIAVLPGLFVDEQGKTLQDYLIS